MADYVSIINDTKESFGRIYSKADNEIKLLYEKLSLNESDPMSSVINNSRISKQIGEIMANANGEAFNLIDNLMNEIKTNPELANSPALSGFLSAIGKIQVYIANMDADDEIKKKANDRNLYKFKDYIWKLHSEQINNKINKNIQEGINDALNDDFEILEALGDLFEAVKDRVDAAGELPANIYDVVRAMDKYQGVNKVRDDYDMASNDADNNYMFEKDASGKYVERVKLVSPDKVENEILKEIYKSIIKDYELLKIKAEEGGLDNARAEVLQGTKERLLRNCQDFSRFASDLKLSDDICEPVETLSSMISDQLRMNVKRDILIREGAVLDNLFDNQLKLNSENDVQNEAANDPAEKTKVDINEEISPEDISRIVAESETYLNIDNSIADKAKDDMDIQTINAIQNAFYSNTIALFKQKDIIRSEAKEEFRKLTIAADDSYRIILDKIENGFGKNFESEDAIIEMLGGKKAILGDIQKGKGKLNKLSDIFKAYEGDLGPKAVMYKYCKVILDSRKALLEGKDEIFDTSKPISFNKKQEVTQLLAMFNTLVLQSSKQADKINAIKDKKAKAGLEKLVSNVEKYSGFLGYAFTTLSADLTFVDDKSKKLDKILQVSERERTSYKEVLAEHNRAMGRKDPGKVAFTQRKERSLGEKDKDPITLHQPEIQRSLGKH